MDQSPKIFGFKISTVIISLGFMLSGLILLAKSVVMTLGFIAISYLNLRFEKKLNSSGGLIPYLLSFISKQESVRVDCTVKFLVNKNKSQNVK